MFHPVTAGTASDPGWVTGAAPSVHGIEPARAPQPQSTRMSDAGPSNNSASAIVTDPVHQIRYRRNLLSEASLIDCACCGLALSWIPPVGCLSCCFNYDASFCSKRSWLVAVSCIISTTLTIVIIVVLFYVYG